MIRDCHKDRKKAVAKEARKKTERKRKEGRAQATAAVPEDRMESGTGKEVVKETAGSGKPFLAICVGLQLLFDSSEESPGAEGLKIFPGKIRRIPATDGLKVPQIGWNSLHIERKSRILDGVDEGAFVYFVHSYYLESAEEEPVIASTEYAAHIHAAVERDNVFATQFHPEKSGKVGLAILRAFCEMKEGSIC